MNARPFSSGNAGAWFGVLLTGPSADYLSRKRTIQLAVVIFVIGVIIQTSAEGPQSIYAGRFIVGLGVGSLSMVLSFWRLLFFAKIIRIGCAVV